MSERPTYLEAMSELHSVLLDPQTPVEIVNSVLRMTQRSNELVTLELEPSPAFVAGEFSLKLQASDLLLEMIAALRAMDGKRLAILEHHGLRRSERKLE